MVGNGRRKVLRTTLSASSSTVPGGGSGGGERKRCQMCFIDSKITGARGGNLTVVVVPFDIDREVSDGYISVREERGDVEEGGYV